MLSKLLTLKALGIALPAVALTAGSAAAATGSLPGPAQSAVSSALSNVGVHVPNGHDTSSPANAVGPDATGPAKYGLCAAYAANAGHASSRSVAFANLQKAATAAGKTVTQFCAGVTPSNGNSSNDNGSNDSSGTGNSSNGHGKSGSNGASNHSDTPDGPPSSTPGSAGTPDGPPSSTPASGTAPVSTPDGPPSSTPVAGH
jgi:hypothetical protein